MSNSKLIVLKTLPFEFYVAFAVFLILQWLLYANLGAAPISIWDEAIYALNSLDMSFSGDPIVLTRGGEVNLYNTKPPFVIWLQALSINIFGINELAIRIPSALSATLTCIVILYFSHKTLRDIRIGIIAIAVLCTSLGYVRPHVTRTGDLDAFLVFWVTLYSSIILELIINKQSQAKLLIYASIAIGFAFLTKSVAGFLALPGLVICSIIGKRFIEILKMRHLYFGVAIVLVFWGGYYLLREYLASGYMSHMLHSEYSRYATNVMPWHTTPFDYYIQNLTKRDFFTPYVYLFLPCIAIGIAIKKYRLMTIMAITFCIAYAGVLSFAEVKLPWYDAPLYPWYALIIGVGAIGFYDRLVSKGKLHTWLFPVLLLLFLSPFLDRNEENMSNIKPKDKLEFEGYSLRSLDEQGSLPKKVSIVASHKTNAHYTQIEWYIQKYNYNGHDITLLKGQSSVSVGDTVLSCQLKTMDSLQVRFTLDTIASLENMCHLIVTK